MDDSPAHARLISLVDERVQLVETLNLHEHVARLRLGVMRHIVLANVARELEHLFELQIP